MSPLKQYLILFGMLVFTAGFVGMIYLIKKSLGKTMEEPGKIVPAESGNLSPKPAWGRYHVHYYSFALLFLAFDMEMAYMYPWAVVYKELGIMALLDMGVFLMILFLGLIYTWNQGGLKRQ
ncbi:NADH-quinone oxidoreductase subunit A [Catalinimonas sp. 4WD22]|jgi:NADH-quinone oxidoreductase subunit A|uniref:NADH-quinone oxidoreductase subunit A n=1 Tax=Catalinimonas locisalis TaxID=3133978 RepID=UPI003100C366